MASSSRSSRLRASRASSPSSTLPPGTPASLRTCGPRLACKRGSSRLLVSELPRRLRRSVPPFCSTRATSLDDRAPVLELVLHTICGSRDVVVLPDSDDSPALGDQDRFVLRIALTVGQQLPAPEVGIGLREVGVLLAVVPEAAIDEHRDPGAREDEVRPYPTTRAHPPVDEEATPTSVQFAAYSQLGRRVATTESGHVTSPRVIGFPVLHCRNLGRRSAPREVGARMSGIGVSRGRL